jgi:hypothetical protein
MKHLYFVIGFFLTGAAIFLTRFAFTGSVEGASIHNRKDYLLKLVDWLFTFDVPVVSVLWYSGLIIILLGLRYALFANKRKHNLS